MKATVTRTYKLNDKQLKKFMEDLGYTEEEGGYTEEDVENELEGASADDLEYFGSYDSIWDQDIDIDDEGK